MKNFERNEREKEELNLPFMHAWLKSKQVHGRVCFTVASEIMEIAVEIAKGISHR